MKKILLFLLVFSVTSTGMAWPWDKKETKVKPVPVAAVKPIPKPTLQDSRQLVKEIAVELKAAQVENSRLKNSLLKAGEKIKQAELRTTEVQKSADTLKEWGIIQQAEAQRFMEKYNNAVKRYHRLKMIAALIAAAVGVFVGLQFMNLVPPPYNFGVPIGGATLFAALVWFFL